MSGLPPIALLTQDSPGILPESGPAQWGIFGQDGQPVLVSDAVGSVEYEREYDISNYPQEQGAFESYNKVQVPYSAKVTLLSGQTRQQLLETLDPIVASLDLVSVVMPEISYPSANLLRYGFRRTFRNGVSLIAVDVWCKEIRYISSSPTDPAANPTGLQQPTGGTDRPVGQVNGGSNLAPGSSTSSPPKGAMNTGSTNAAYPTTSGAVQPFNAAGISGAPGTQSGSSSVPPLSSFVSPLTPPT